jgi:hypothetical protein
VTQCEKTYVATDTSGMTITIHHSKSRSTRNSSAITLVSPTARKLVLPGSGTFSSRSTTVPSTTAMTRIATSRKIPGPPQLLVPWILLHSSNDADVSPTMTAPASRPASAAATRPDTAGMARSRRTSGGAGSASGSASGSGAAVGPATSSANSGGGASGVGGTGGARGWVIAWSTSVTLSTSSRIVVGLSSADGASGAASFFFLRRNNDGGSSEGPVGSWSSPMRAVSQTSGDGAGLPGRTGWPAAAMSATTPRLALAMTRAPASTLTAKTPKVTR